MIEWGVAVLPLASERESGDLHLVKVSGWGALVAVVDGAGHGAVAAAAARLAVDTLTQADGHSIAELMRRCHDELKGTRGVVMSIASLDGRENQMTWLGVGNVVGILVRRLGGAPPVCDEIVLRSGTVGYRLPSLRAAALPVSPGDTLVLATDGIRADFSESVNLDDPPSEIAERICAEYGKGTDDGLVLVVRYLGVEAR